MAAEHPEIDLANPDSYVEGVPYDWFDHLRHEHPVFWHPERPPNKGFWAVTRYDDLTAIHMDWQTYSSELGAVALEELDDEQLEIRKSMLETDPPRHTQLRRICSSRFSARGVGKYEDWIREVASDVLDKALPDGRVRLRARDQPGPPDPIPLLDLHRPAGGRATADLLGRPDDREPGPRPLRPPWSTEVDTEAYRLLPFRSPTAYECSTTPTASETCASTIPPDDVINALTVAQSEGVLNEQEFHNYFGVLMIAGQRDHPPHDQPRDARADGASRAAASCCRKSPSGSRDATEEILRWATPVHALPADGDPRRRAARREDRAGRQGRHVVHSANRDDEVFPDPYTFDVTRTPNDHVTFGPGGPHFCLGAHLARLETKILFQELLPRLKSIELAGPVERIRSDFVNGIKRMPVRVTNAS